MGRCIAHELAHLGASVLITGRTPEKLARVAAEIEDDGGLVKWAVCDVREEDLVRETVSTLCSGEPLQGLVNCAGGQFPALLSEMSTKGFEAVVRNNLTSAYIVSRAVYDYSMADHGGAIVNITTDHTGGMPLMGHTGAARAGVENLTATAALEWAENGVRVNAVAPGYVETSGFDTYTDQRMLNALGSFAQHTPLGRLGREAEVSAAVCFLLSEAAAFITGQSWRVDGGFGLKTSTPMLERESIEAQRAFDGFHRSEPPRLLRELKDGEN